MLVLAEGQVRLYELGDSDLFSQFTISQVRSYSFLGFTVYYNFLLPIGYFLVRYYGLQVLQIWFRGDKSKENNLCN